MARFTVGAIALLWIAATTIGILVWLFVASKTIIEVITHRTAKVRSR